MNGVAALTVVVGRWAVASSEGSGQSARTLRSTLLPICCAPMRASLCCWELLLVLATCSRVMKREIGLSGPMAQAARQGGGTSGRDGTTSAMNNQAAAAYAQTARSAFCTCVACVCFATFFPFLLPKCTNTYVVTNTSLFLYH
jgi:hypothetical protein